MTYCIKDKVLGTYIFGLGRLRRMLRENKALMFTNLGGILLSILSAITYSTHCELHNFLCVHEKLNLQKYVEKITVF